MRLFADDSSLFIKVRDVAETQSQLMDDLNTITNWARQWKMEFNPDITKQAIEVIFSHKKNKPDHPPLSFNGIPVKRESHTEHLGVILDERLNFRLHIQEKTRRCMIGSPEKCKNWKKKKRKNKEKHDNNFRTKH